MMIEVICIRGNGDKEMDPIDDPLINTDAMAIRRGTHEIDKQWYLVHIQNIEVPFKHGISGQLFDDDIVTVSDAIFGITGARKIRRIDISGTPSEISMKAEIAKYEEFV